MRSAQLLKGVAVCLAVTGMCLPQTLLAADNASRSTGLVDVELRDGGVLLGQLVDPQGIPQADATVILLDGGRKLAETRTDRQGSFAFQGLRGGVYQLTAAEGVGAYRLWAPGTAPPSSQPGALVVAGTDLVRGNFTPLRNCTDWCRFHLCNPFVLAALTATAITVPIVLNNTGKEQPVSPP